jgi:hypothetical protein
MRGLELRWHGKVEKYFVVLELLRCGLNFEVLG